jgi:uncharacterized cysteine cluster protein YcgN (CxxCxxCC family)
VSYIHKQECPGFIIDDDETPTIGNVSCAHLEPGTLRCRFFEDRPKCDDMALAETVPLRQLIGARP